MKFITFAFNFLSSTGLLSTFVSSLIKKKEYRSALIELFITNKKIFRSLIIFNFGQMIFWGIFLIFSNGFLYNFSLMSAAWALINSIIFVIAYYQSNKYIEQSSEVASFATDFTKISSIQNILAFNAGLDILYCVVGYFIIDKMQTIQLDAFGAAIILQGMLLLATDIILLIVNRRMMQKILAEVE